MKELISYIARALVDHPEDVHVSCTENGNMIEYVLTVHPLDVGKMIGKQGKTINSLRILLTSLSVKETKRIKLEIERSPVVNKS